MINPKCSYCTQTHLHQYISSKSEEIKYSHLYYQAFFLFIIIIIFRLCSVKVLHFFFLHNNNNCLKIWSDFRWTYYYIVHYIFTQIWSMRKTNKQECYTTRWNEIHSRRLNFRCRVIGKQMTTIIAYTDSSNQWNVYIVLSYSYITCILENIIYSWYTE